MNFRKIIAITSAVALSAAFLTSCGTSKSSSSAATSTANSTTASAAAPSGAVKMLVAVTGGKDDAEMKLFEAAISKATGLQVTMEKPADYNTALAQKLSAGEKYDLVYLDQPAMATLVGQGALLDLTSRVQNSTIMQNNIDPQEWKDIAIDGKYYAGFNKQETIIPVALNATQLQTAGLDYKTIDPSLSGYESVFTTLKSKITTKNYYPLDIDLKDTWNLQPWFASAGLKGGVSTDTDGKTFAPYASDAAAPVWDWLAKLYSEKLLDPACAVDGTGDIRTKMEANAQTVSVCSDWLAWIGLHNAHAVAAGVTADKYSIVALPGCKTPDGTYMVRKGNASLFGVPANSPNPDGAFKVLEFFATQEGGNMLSAGLEGTDYTVSGSTYTLTSQGAAHGLDHGAPFPIFKDYAPLFPYNPGVQDGLSLKQYAAIETPIVNENDYKSIIGKWAIQIVTGKIDSKTGLSKMRADLVAQSVTQK